MIVMVFVTLAASGVYKSQAPGRPERLNFVRWHLTFVGLQCGTGLYHPSWRMEFRDGSWIYTYIYIYIYIFFKSVHPCPTPTVVWYYFSGLRYTQSLGTELLELPRLNHAYQCSFGGYYQGPFVTFRGQNQGTALNRSPINIRWSFRKLSCPGA
jgi:hypothetical protein